jgi:hypothetical protein
MLCCYRWDCTTWRIKPENAKSMLDTASSDYTAVARVYFVQYHLHLQLLSASRYAIGCYICVLILLYMCPHTTAYVCPHAPILFSPTSILSYLAPRGMQSQKARACALKGHLDRLLYMCPHTTTCVSSCYSMCPHATVYVSLCYYTGMRKARACALRATFLSASRGLA